MAEIWTYQRIDILKQLVSAGDSCSIIARKLSDRTGGCFTRNAVIGKIHRLKLEMRKLPVHRRLEDRSHHRKKSFRKKPAVILQITPTPEIISEHPVSMLEIKPGMCHWIIGDPTAYPAMMCNDAVAYKGASYCQYHRKLGTQESRHRIRLRSSRLAWG